VSVDVSTDATLGSRVLGKPAGAIDVLIAGHARAPGVILVSANTRNYTHVPGLALENWWDGTC